MPSVTFAVNKNFIVFDLFGSGLEAGLVIVLGTVILIISGRIFPIVNDLIGMDLTVFPYTATIEAYKLSLEGIGFITTLLNTV